MPRRSPSILSFSGWVNDFERNNLERTSLMSTISATAVKTLRDRTNLPMMECKAALTEANGDMDKAIEVLRKKFANAAIKRVDRETAEGRICVWIASDMKTGAIVEMRCESPPVVKADGFISLGNELAQHIALKNPANVEELLTQPFGDGKGTVTDRIHEAIGLIRENMKVARFQRVADHLLGSYVHHDGTVGVLLVVDGERADPQILKDVCMHITANNPLAALREDIAPEVVAKEKEIAIAQAAATGKPAQIAEKIADGKLKTWFAQNVLVEQPFVKDDSKTVGQLLQGAGLKLVKFIRFKVGEVVS